MKDWNMITKNLNSHGHFAGTKEAEQDAYFDFFAGNDHNMIEALSSTRINCKVSIVKLLKRLALRDVPGEITLSKLP